MGYLLGDGAFSKRTNKKLEKMSVSSIEEYIISFFNKYFQPDNKYRSRIPINKTRDIVTEKHSHILPLTSVLTETLKKYHIMGIKQNRMFYNIDDESLMKSYILGLIDSDGYVSYHYGYNSSDKNRIPNENKILKHTIGITHPSSNMLADLNLYLNKTLGINGTIDKKQNEKCMLYRINSRPDIRTFIRWLYSDLPCIYNIGKYDKMKSLLDILEAPVLDIKGVKRSKARVESYTAKYGSEVVIGTFKDYDDAVSARLIYEAKNISKIKHPQNFNSYRKTIQLNYINHQDNLQTFIEVDLNGEIINFKKLS